jgi:hypothetical protein
MTFLEPVSPTLIIQTRKGNLIPNEPGVELTPLRRNQAREQINRLYPSVLFFTERKPPTGAYNCHGLTFLNRRAWLTKSEAIETVLRDDAYSEVPIERTMPGDVVLYRDRAGEIEHTGMVARMETEGGLPTPFILSKWGMAGEYIHRYNLCPYGDGGITFWREGKND